MNVLTLRQYFRLRICAYLLYILFEEMYMYRYNSIHMYETIMSRPFFTLQCFWKRFCLTRLFKNNQYVYGIVQSILSRLSNSVCNIVTILNIISPTFSYTMQTLLPVYLLHLLTFLREQCCTLYCIFVPKVYFILVSVRFNRRVCISCRFLPPVSSI